MRVNNSLQRQNSSKPKFSVAIQTPMYQKLVNDTLGDPERARRFVASISSAVAVNPALQECDAGTVLTAALLGESLNLSPSPQLGQYYMVPYNDKKRGKVAQFQIGYKGYIQLAERSGQYLDLDAFPVVEGEYKGRDRFTRRPILEFLEDDGERENRPVVGYYAYFELTNGFRKVLYWSREKMLAHADRYSQAFYLNGKDAQDARYSRVSYADFLAGNYPQGDDWKYSSFWYKDFDGMACKTMLRQLMRSRLLQAYAGNSEAQKAMDAILAQTALTYGEAVTEDGTGKELGHRLRLPMFRVADIITGYEIHARRDEETMEYIIGVVPRETVEEAAAE